MKTNDFLKDFIGENEVVTVSAIQLKRLLLQQDQCTTIINDLKSENIALKKAIIALKQQVIWDEAQKPRHINLEA